MKKSVFICVFACILPLISFGGLHKSRNSGLWGISKGGRAPVVFSAQEELLAKAINPLNDFIRALKPESVGTGMERNLLFNLFAPFQQKIDSVRWVYRKQPDSLQMHVARLEYDRTRLLRIFLTEKQWQAYWAGVRREAERNRRYQRALKEKGMMKAVKEWEEEERKLREKTNNK